MPSVLSKFAINEYNEDKDKEEKFRTEWLKRILKNDSDQINVRYNGVTPLMKLCLNFPNEYNNLKLLLDNGACPNIPDYDGNLPYMILKEKGYDSACELLINYGSKTKKVSDYSSSSSNRYVSKDINDDYKIRRETIRIDQIFGNGKNKKKIVKTLSKKVLNLEDVVKCLAKNFRK